MHGGGCLKSRLILLGRKVPNGVGATSAELPVSIIMHQHLTLFTRDVIVSGTAIVLNYESSWKPCTDFSVLQIPHRS